MTKPKTDDPRLKAVRALGAIRKRPALVFATQGPIEEEHLLEVERVTRGLQFPGIDLWLSSDGGAPNVAYLIMLMLRRRFGEIHAVVPNRAKSAATVMAVGCDSILLGRTAHLGPIDVQVGRLDAFGSRKWTSSEIAGSSLPLIGSLAFAHLRRIYDVAVEKPRRGSRRSPSSPFEAANLAIESAADHVRPLARRIQPVLIARDRRLNELGKSYAKDLMARVAVPLSERDRDRAVTFLAEHYGDHGFTINARKAREYRLPVKTGAPSEVQVLSRPLVAAGQVMSWADLRMIEVVHPQSRRRVASRAVSAPPPGGQPSSEEVAAAYD